MPPVGGAQCAPAAQNKHRILSNVPHRANTPGRCKHRPLQIFFRAIPHNSKCRYGERGAADAKPKAQIILDAAKVSAASGGNSEPKHDAGTATRHYRAFWQRRCRAAAAGAVLKPQGGNCAVLPKVHSKPFMIFRGGIRASPLTAFYRPAGSYKTCRNYTFTSHRSGIWKCAK